MNPGDLTTLANAKAWLGSTDDDLLRRLISSQSQLMQNWLNRRIAFQQYNEIRDGQGMGKGRWTMMFGNPPVASLLSLTVNGQAVTPSPDGGVLQAGYGFDSQQIWLAQNTPSVLNSFGAQGFPRGRANVKLSYMAGFLIFPTLTTPDDNSAFLPAEQQTIPSANTPTQQVATNYTWLSDNAVLYAASNVPFVKVTGTPTVGQYAVKNGSYVFSSADAGQNILLSYSYVPYDIEQACIEMVGLRYKERGRIGEVSKGIGGETISYSQKDMPASVSTVLKQYKKVFSV